MPRGPGSPPPLGGGVLKKAALLLACACALLAAIPAVAAVGPSQADTNTTQADTNTTATGASEPQARAAGPRIHARYRHWRQKLHHYGVWRGRNLVLAAASDSREPTARELRRSIRRMKRRFATLVEDVRRPGDDQSLQGPSRPAVGHAEARLDRMVRVAQRPACRRWRRGVPRPLPVQLQHLARGGRMGRPRRRSALGADVEGLAPPVEARQRPLAGLRLVVTRRHEAGARQRAPAAAVRPPG